MMHDLQAKLKRLKTARKLKNESIDRVRKELADKQEELTKLRNETAGIDRQINEILSSDKPLVVTEHAILRFLERVVGFNLDELKNQILPDEIESRIKSMGSLSGKFPVSDTHRVVVRNRQIVTIETEDYQKQNKKKSRPRRSRGRNKKKSIEALRMSELSSENY